MSEKAILLTNLGSPDSPDTADVRRYLGEFLMDERVIDIPYMLRLMLVKGIIVPFRAPKSAAKYAGIWTKNGSPLVHTTGELCRLTGEASGLPSYFCMRYGNPSPADVLQRIAAEHPDLKELHLLPLYPHYAMSSYETAVEHVRKAHRIGQFTFRLHVTPPYYKDSAYINALAASIKPYIEKPYDHLLFSYHGIPERHLKKTDFTAKHCLSCNNCCETPSDVHGVCYRHQVRETSKAVAAELSIPENRYSVAFQSRLGQDKWLKPYTAAMLAEMPSKGIKNLLVVCPAFVSDCLETLEEIHIEGKEIFMHAGGTSFTAIPCLNTDPLWVKTLVKLISNQRP